MVKTNSPCQYQRKKYKKSRENIKPHGVGTSYKKGRDVELF